MDLHYELTDHLGNVAAVVTGRLLPDFGAGTNQQAELVSAQGYEAFGSLLPGRNYSSDAYRFGFNGQEKVDEVNGSVGTHNTAEFWEYDVRAAHRWNLDPKPNPAISQYAAFSLNPLLYSDVLGDTIVINLFSRWEKRHFHAVAEAAVSKQVDDGVFLVFGHGGNLGVDVPDKNGDAVWTTTPEDFNAGLARLSPEFAAALNEGRQIVLTLYTCNAANEDMLMFDNITHFKKEDTFAEQVSRSLPQGSTVNAPDGYVQYGIKKPKILGVSETYDGHDPDHDSGFETLINGKTVSRRVFSYDAPAKKTPAPIRSKNHQ